MPKLLLILFFLCLPEFSYAQSGGGPLPPGLFGAGRPSLVNFRAEAIEDFGRDNENSYQDRSVSLVVRPIRKEKQSLFVSYETREKEISNSDLVLEDGVLVNNQLRFEEFGVGYTYNTDKSRSWTVTGGFGARSDDLYKRSEDNTIRLSLVYVKQRTKSKWILGAFYNNNLNLGFNILPIIAYAYQPSRNFSLITGVPFLNLTWGSFMGTSLFVLATPGGARTQFNYSILGPFALFTGAEWSNENFEHVNRLNDQNQFIIERNTVFLGLRAPVVKGFMLKLIYGYRFNTRYFQAEGLFDNADKFSIANSDFGSLSLSARF